MANELVSDELWSKVQPLLPRTRRYPKGGRPRVDDRAVFTGIVFVLRTGLPWRYLPREMGCGSGVTCWRRLRDWQRRGVWKKLHHAMLEELDRRGALSRSAAVIDSASVRAVLGARTRVPVARIGANQAANGT